MMKDRMITQRELRNDSGAVLREVEAGRTVIVSRNGTPVGSYDRSRAADLWLVQSLRLLPGAPHGSMPRNFVRTWMHWLIPSHE